MVPIYRCRTGAASLSSQLEIHCREYIKALIAYVEGDRANVAGGELIVKRDGAEFARQAIAPGAHNTITVAGIAAQLTPGENSALVFLVAQPARRVIRVAGAASASARYRYCMR